MSSLNELEIRLTRARCWFLEEGNKEVLNSALDEIEAGSETGCAAILTAQQTQCLHYYLDSVSAMREIRRRGDLKAARDEAERRSNIVPFPGKSHFTAHRSRASQPENN